MTGFGINLRKELEYKNIKIKELAERTGISIRTLENYISENGSWPSSDKALIIADVLGCSLDKMMGNVGKSFSGSFDVDCQNYLKKLLSLPGKERKLVFDLIDLLSEKK